MDTKTIAFGVAIATISIGGSAAVSVITGGDEKPVETQIVAASEQPADVAMAAVAAVAPSGQTKTCAKDWVQVDQGEPRLAWLCDGAYVPGAQEELDKLAPNGVKVEYVPRDDNGVTVYDATIYEGEAREQPAMMAAAVEDASPSPRPDLRPDQPGYVPPKQ